LGCFPCVDSTDSAAPFAVFDTVDCDYAVLFADFGIAGSYSADQVDADIADSCYVARPEAGDIAAEAGNCYVAALQAGDIAVAVAGENPDEVVPELVDQDAHCRGLAGVYRLVW